MSVQGSRRTTRRSVLVASAAVLAVLVVVALVLSGWWGGRSTDRVDPLPDPGGQVLLAPHPASQELPPGGDIGPTTGTAVEGVLAVPLAEASLGPVRYSVNDVVTGQRLAAEQPGTLTTPASTTKLLTAAAVLTSVSGQERLVTRVVSGLSPQEVVLVGGGDTTLARDSGSGTYQGAALVSDLAAATLSARESAGLMGTGITRIVVDSSLYEGPGLAPGVPPTWVAGGSMSPMRPVMVDGGREDPQERPRVAEPDLVAGRSLADALGVPSAEVVHGTAPAGARELAEVHSPTLNQLVHTMLVASDNVLAEVLGRMTALELGLPASYAGSAEAVRTAVGRLGLRESGVALFDSSGLSPQDRIAPDVLTGLLVLAAREQVPSLDVMLAALPVSGYSGTLTDRYREDPAAAPAAGEVRAKTGRLPDVVALAGLVETGDGRLLAFAFQADRVPGSELDALEGLDRAAAALAACLC